MKLVLLQIPLDPHAGRPNLDACRDEVEAANHDLGADDVVLLPEHVHRGPARDAYEDAVRALAVSLGCHVVGGSHEGPRLGRRVNAGIAVDARGETVGHYEKLRPYADERKLVEPGEPIGEFSIGGRRILAVICSDFWFADLFQRAHTNPDLVVVPALSVSRKPTPHYSRALWQHMAVSRAYEFGIFVGISDWARGDELPSCAVGGLANPATADPEAFFAPIGDGGLRCYDLDFDALDTFRRDRVQRGFFWRPGEPEPDDAP